MIFSARFKKLRILVLLLLLFTVAVTQCRDSVRFADWKQTLWVVIYPVNGDGSPQSQQYIENLREGDFHEIGDFMRQEVRRYGLRMDDPVTIKLAPEIREHPPSLPPQETGLSVMWWSLKMRWWAYHMNNYDGPRPDVQMFISYFDPRTHDRLNHSTGLEKGRIGLVNAFASPQMAAQNLFVITHELLHTFGATDKYDLATNQPRFPDGYAEPGRTPLYPQGRAEVMGGRIPLSAHESRIPGGLGDAIIGLATAAEIHWIK